MVVAAVKVMAAEVAVAVVAVAFGLPTMVSPRLISLRRLPVPRSSVLRWTLPFNPIWLLSRMQNKLLQIRPSGTLVPSSGRLPP